MILIIGGAGYIGSQVCKTLSCKGKDFVVLDNLTNGHRSFVKWSELIKGDVGDKVLLNQIFNQYKISAVMHFAAFSYVGESMDNPRKYYDNNLSNSLNLLNVMCENDIKKIIFSSTCATYGNPVSIPIEENHNQNPVNPYGTSKYIIERILTDYDRAYGLKSVIFRYFNAAGADKDTEVGERHDPETHLIPLVLETAAGKRDYITIFGDDYETRDGTCIRDYIHVQDLANAHIKGLDYLDANKRSAVFNLGNGAGFSIFDVIAAAERISGKKIIRKIGKRRLGDPAILVGSSRKAKKVLNWNPEFKSIDMIIDTAWKWHCKDWNL